MSGAKPDGRSLRRWRQVLLARPIARWQVHSCALAASQMGASLRAESEGIGHGAAFILELPLRTGEEIEEKSLT